MGKFYNPEFHLLGKRKYVHGTSQTHLLAEALKKWEINGVKRIVGAFHEILRSGGTYWLFNSKQEQTDSRKDYVSSYIVDSESGKFYIGLEGNGDPVCSSVPYDEDAIVGASIINVENRSATLFCSADYHIFNTLVALNKKLHFSTLPRDEKTQWYFGGFDLKWPLIVARSAEDILSVTITSVFNDNYSRSVIAINGLPVGHISFAREVAK